MANGLPDKFGMRLHNGNTQETACLISGPLCIHRTISYFGLERDEFAVSHVATGVSVWSKDLNYTKARRLMKKLIGLSGWDSFTIDEKGQLQFIDGAAYDVLLAAIKKELVMK